MNRTGWLIDARCLTCAGPLTHTAHGTTHIIETSIVATCLHCRRQHLIKVSIYDVTEDVRARPWRVKRPVEAVA